MNAFSSLLMSIGLLSAAAIAAPAPPPWSVTFVIDMKARIAAKTFDPAKDAVGVRGGFAPLGWDVTTPALDPDGDGLYEVTIAFPKRPFGGQAATYKFKVEKPGAEPGSTPNDGWEEGRNRLVTLDAPAQTVRRAFDEPPPPIVAAHSGTIRSHPAFASRFLAPRDVTVYLPPGYEIETEKEAKRRYPVLYLHDGQNLFDAVSAGMEWQVDETAERLIRAGAIEPLIVVGIANTEARRDEYTPTRDERGGGKADLYGRLIVEELKPFIDRTYRTRPMAAATGIGGASLGGLVSLYLGLKHPDVFGTIFAVSPHVWWDHGVILKTVAALPKKSAQRIWVDVGTGEGEEYLDGVRRLRGALTAKGWKIGKELAYTEDEGAQHDELSWAARVEPMLRWAVGSGNLK